VGGKGSESVNAPTERGFPLGQVRGKEKTVLRKGGGGGTERPDVSKGINMRKQGGEEKAGVTNIPVGVRLVGRNML